VEMRTVTKDGTLSTTLTPLLTRDNYMVSFARGGLLPDDANEFPGMRISPIVAHIFNYIGLNHRKRVWERVQLTTIRSTSWLTLTLSLLERDGVSLELDCRTGVGGSGSSTELEGESGSRGE
jgi:hypothetical protein